MLKAERPFILLPILLFLLAYNSFVLAEESPKRVLSLVDYIGGDYKNNRIGSNINSLSAFSIDNIELISY